MNNNLNKESSESQCMQIYGYLQDGNTLTSLEALNLFSCFRLASRISDLRSRGVDVKKRTIVTESGKRIAQYYI